MEENSVLLQKKKKSGGCGVEVGERKMRGGVGWEKPP